LALWLALLALNHDAIAAVQSSPWYDGESAFWGMQEASRAQTRAMMAGAQATHASLLR